MFKVWTERKYVTRRLVNKSMSYHLTFSLETSPTIGSWTACNWAEVRSVLRMDVDVGTARFVSMRISKNGKGT